MFWVGEHGSGIVKFKGANIDICSFSKVLKANIQAKGDDDHEVGTDSNYISLIKYFKSCEVDEVVDENMKVHNLRQ